MIHYNNCPVCGSTDLSGIFKVKDQTVSKESFLIVECGNCSLRFTQDVPDSQSIAPYYQSDEYISHTNTSKGLVNKLYLRVRKITLKKKRKLVSWETKKTKGKLLDIGSGTGAFVNEMKQAGWEVIGLEPDPGAREVANKQYGVKLLEMTAFDRLDKNTFDAITLWHVLEHVHDLHVYVKHLHELLKEDGKLILAVPNYTSKDAAIYKENWAAYDVPRHLYHFSPRSMQLLLEKHGFHIESCKPMWYDSFYISLLSSKYKNGKARLAAAFMNGLRSNLKAMVDMKRCSSVIYIATPRIAPGTTPATISR